MTVTIDGLLGASKILDSLKTASSTDVTAGKLLQVGDFGLGGYCINTSGQDCDDFPAYRNGHFMGSNLSNSPDGTASWFYIHQLVHNSNYATQVAYNLANDPVLSYCRHMNNGVWGAWTKVYLGTNILGAVSESAGVPTGAIIERGSNANGEYVKFADGTMICTVALTVTDQAVTTAYGGMYIGSRNILFPATYIASPECSVTRCRAAGTSGWGTLSGVPNTTYASLNALDVVSRASGNSFQIGLIAIGRWF